MSMTGHIRCQVDDGVGTITIDREERFNSFDVETARDFRKAGLGLARDRSVRCIVVTGAGERAFSSGADLKYVREGGEDADLGYLAPEAQPPRRGHGAAFKQILEYLHSTIAELRKAPKPVVAGVNGIAAAGGFGIAMTCDLVCASEDATFEWAYPKTGLTGAESSTFFLPRLLGFHKAMELILLSPRLSAMEAFEMGLVNRVFPADSFRNEVQTLANRLAEGPTEAFAVAKGLINDATGMARLGVHLDTELIQLSRIAETAHFDEGLKAFFEKRRPSFQ